MDANKSFLLLLAVVLVAPASAQQTGRTMRHHRVAVEEPSVSPLVNDAETAIEKKDYAAAEKKLAQAVSQDPKDYRALYDLGFIYKATGRTTQAIDAYRKSVAAKPDIFESNLNLGILLASAGDPGAEGFLRKATELKPSAHPEEGLARAWLSLGHFIEKARPADALTAFQKAAELQPRDTEPHLAAGAVLEQQDRLAEAEKEYQQAAQLRPYSSDALAALVNVYTRQRRLPEAEAALRRYLAQDPSDAAAHVQLGRILMAQERAAEATAEYESALKLDPYDVDANRELAAVLVKAKNYAQAVSRYQVLVQANPDDAQLHYELGSALLRSGKFPEAQAQLGTAVRLKPDLADAYGDLAWAASENKNYPLAIQALDARARYLAETPGTYFLRATSYDSLRDYMHAAENYRRFLAAAAGKFPDQEWQARHRLVAIDPKKK